MNDVDSVSKVSHFILTHTMITTLGVACLFLAHIWKLHRLLKQVISDQGLQFIAELMQELYHLLSIKLAATTAYHLQGDGQMEQVNQDWNNISASLSMRGRMTEMNCFHWQSSSTIIMYTLLHSKLPSCLTLEGTHGWALSHIRWSPDWKQSTSSRTGWTRP